MSFSDPTQTVPNLRLDDLADRFRGAIVGLAVGDALGYPGEFRSRAQILASFPPDGVRDFVRQHDRRWPEKPYIIGADLPAGSFSDDTQMSVAVAEALVEAGDRDLDTLMVVMGRRFIEWYDSPKNNRAPGETCGRGVAALKAGTPWRQAGVAASKGAGAAMRAGAIGLYYAHDHARLLEVARASSLLTHGHDAAIEGSAAVALMVALALEERTVAEMYARVAEACAGRSADFDRCWKRLGASWSLAPEVALSEAGLGEAWVSEEAAASALYCLSRAPGSYEGATLIGANTDGDSDTIACVTGAIAGARYGYRRIPPRFSEAVEDAARLVELADRLYARAMKAR